MKKILILIWSVIIVVLLSAGATYAGTDRSGMIVCNPSEKESKSVLYTFYGFELAEDN